MTHSESAIHPPPLPVSEGLAQPHGEARQTGGHTRTAVVVVHGVGDPKEGSALGGLMAGLSERGFRQAGVTRVEERVEPNDEAAGEELVSTYPVHRATMVSRERSADGETSRHVLYLHEVYWGDISRVKGGIGGVMLGLFDLIFGMRHIASAAAKDAYLSASDIGRWTGRSCWFAGKAALAAEQLARGPMLALNILLATVAALQGLMVEFVPWLPFKVEHVASVLGPILVFLAAGLLRRGMLKRKWSLATLYWLMGLSGLALLLAVALLLANTPQAFVEAVTSAMSLGAFLMALAAIVMMFVSGLVVFAAKFFQGASTPRSAWRDMSRALIAMNFSTAFGVGLFVLLALVTWTAVGDRIGPPLGDRITQGLHLFGLVWMAFIGAAAVYLVIALLNECMNRSGTTADRHRYIVNTWVWVIFLSVSFAYALLFVPLSIRLEAEAICLWQARTPDAAIDRFMDEFRPCVSAFWGWDFAIFSYFEWIQPVEGLKNWAIAMTLGLLAGGAIVRTHLLQALDLLLDVVVHFQTGPQTMNAKTQEKTRYPSWSGILSRFEDVLGHVGRVDRVVVVAHSQGTMVALHALELLSIQDRLAKVGTAAHPELDLVTMGCPADHLYRYYMPRTYRMPIAASRVVRWLNLYRRDDYIGTELRFDGAPGPKPLNQPIKPRGHVNYWRDREVIQHLVSFMTRRPAPPPSTP